MMFELLAQTQSAAPAAPGAGGAGGGFLNLLPIWFFIIVIMYFVLIRPQKKRQQEQQRLVTSLKTGDRVVTNAGIHGLIANVRDTTVMLKIADNVKIEVEKSAVTNVLKSE
ncbi:MAG TPA: preprotein translocase subunit YajC [Chthoniobacterales bacterium]|jgi:preprotein translocase subunit YajC|nr:preprotein translocase subunit YajC [Chthoniobacterales bacterium]